ncbi:MAG: DEAD/DEAH box helicase [Pseudomonadales bacterium]|jgi:ATP-dependent RNA helicase DeaD|nr:DEAD/DEAH box helicase [Pseudomonadales bacterium]
MSESEQLTFQQLALSAPILQALNDVGYETPSPIQAETIPLLLSGRDVLGQAQTGTGKTAAFALPALSNIDVNQRDPQILVLAPTRELAIQVAEAFHKYAKHIKGFNVLPIYGGQEYGGQIRSLKRGVHAVVGTPGRVMDHIRKGTLNLDGLKTLVLDEADEMLRMGFIDDVEWILEQTPKTRQIALFSATMPTQVRRIATAHLTDPAQITIKMKTATANLIRQRFWPVSGMHKLDALTRILEAETFDGMIIFVRTRIATVEVAEKLSARGFTASALNGDIPQAQRERTIDQLKKGKVDIIVATDVAARGLDVERISHVVNYDIPHDTEAYIHRIGRTGRAGREGDAILFVAPRERRMLNAIERATSKKIELMELPSTELINDKRIAQFKQAISDTLATEDLGLFKHLVEQYQNEHNVPAIEIASALAKLVQGDSPLLLQHKPVPRADKAWEARGNDQPRTRDRGKGSERSDRPQRPRKDAPPEKGMQRFRIEVGHIHKVMPGNIVGAIANEANIDAQNIGRINIFDDHSTIDLPADMPDDIYAGLKKVWVAGQTLNISREGEAPKAPSKRSPARRTSDDRGRVFDDDKLGKGSKSKRDAGDKPVKKAKPGVKAREREREKAASKAKAKTASSKAKKTKAAGKAKKKANGKPSL